MTTQSCQRDVNVDHEESLRNFLYDGIDTHTHTHNDGSQYKDIFYVKYFMIKYWWVISYEFVVRIIYLKVLFPHSNVSEFHLLSNLTPYIPPYRYIRGIIGVEILGRQRLRIILWNWEFYYYFYGIKHCTGELFWGCFIFGGLELWHLWWDFILLVAFYLIFLWII